MWGTTLGVDLEEWHKWVVYILGDLILLLTVLGIARKFVFSAIKKVIKDETSATKRRTEETASKVDNLLTVSQATQTDLKELHDVVRKVVYQVQPNKGGSIRDAVDRTEKAVAELTGTVAAIDSKVDEARVDIAGVKGQIKGL